MSDLGDTMNEAVEKARESALNTTVAAMVAITATFLAICNVKGGNVVQGMARAQTEQNNQWSYFQAKSTKQALAEAALDQLSLERDLGGATATGDQKVLIEKKLADYTAKVARYDTEKNAIKKKAEDLQKEYDALNTKDDQFDIAEACISVGIALFGITALTQKRWLLVVAMVFGGFGVLVGLAGFIGWSLRPEWIAKLLG